MPSARLTVLARRTRPVVGAGNRCRRVAGLVVVLALLMLLPLMSGCGGTRLSYAFVDGDQRDYRLSMVVAEKDPGGEVLGTVTLAAVLHTNVNFDERAGCACFVAVDYQDAEIVATGAAQSSGNDIPTAYFHLCLDRGIAFSVPTPRGGEYSLELATTGPNGSLSAMLVNTFVCKCFAQPLRDRLHELKTGNAWTSIQKGPGEYVTYLYTGKRPTGDQNVETTRARVAQLSGDGAFATLHWSSATPLQGSMTVDRTRSLLDSGMDPDAIAVLDPAELSEIVTASGSSNCAGTVLVRTADGWPERATVDRMVVDLTWWSGVSDDPTVSEETAPVELILEITGSIEAIS